jgi:hypothetical protein
MSRRLYLVVVIPVLLFAGIAGAQQYPMMDMIAEKVVQEYQQSTCEQLWQKKGQQKSPMAQEAMQKLRADPDMRTAFINKVAAPIANKMFECGMIP